MSKHAVASVSDPSETGMAYTVLSEGHIDGTFDWLLVCGGTVAPGRTRYVAVTAANTAAQKDTAVLAKLRE